MALPKIIQIPEGDEGALQYHYKRITLSSAQILTSNTVPIEIVEAPGAKKMLYPILLISKTNYGTSTYATNINMYLMFNSSINVIVFSLGYTEDTIRIPNLDTSYEEALADIVNKNLTLKTAIGNPTAGDGTMDIYLWYINLEL